MNVKQIAVVLALLLFVQAKALPADPFLSDWPRPAEVSVTLGKHQVLIPSGQHGLLNFPDMPICVLSKKPLTFFVVGGSGQTYLMSGDTLSSSIPLRIVLNAGSPGSYDNGYAGISSAYIDKAGKRVMGFYHAEDKEGIGRMENGSPGAYWRVCVAEAPQDTLNFTKLGPIITSDRPKKLAELQGPQGEIWKVQGSGDPCVCVSADGQHLLCLYHEASHRLTNGRGVQICLARAPVASRGVPGSWSKYHNGSFTEPGVGGHETPVLSAPPNTVDMGSPHVQYVPAWKRYVCVFSVANGRDFISTPPQPLDTGLYISTSMDAVSWSKPVQVWRIFSVFLNGQEVAQHPCLHIETATDKTLIGQLTYAYTPHSPTPPHHLAGRSIRISLLAADLPPASPRGSEAAEIGVTKPTNIPVPVTSSTGSPGGIVQSGNVALATNGSKASGNRGETLVDGIVGERPPAQTDIKNPWTITFSKVYRLQRIKMQLWSEAGRLYKYKIEASQDGIAFKPLVDREGIGWQVLDFPAQPIKAIRITPLGDSKSPNSGRPYMHVHELEAYCVP